jgi:hypothetical protein
MFELQISFLRFRRRRAARGSFGDGAPELVARTPFARRSLEKLEQSGATQDTLRSTLRCVRK